ncbi:MAG: trypsin-like peptidase domain-containing protein [Deltaproteobacteria bacterium]|nr:MAG: trypsin-like peptidase domain-containing protein [Deltaproteobacteria bacterium]
MMRNKRLNNVLLLVIIIGVWFFPDTNYAFALTPKEIYQKASPGVVFIFASEGSKSGNGGTGSIIRQDGLVITNAHILTRKDSSKLLSSIWVFLKPERVTGNHQADLVRRYKGEVLAYDVKLDLALVKIKNPDVPLTKVDFGDSNRVGVGDQAYAIGHPEQGGLWSLTTGVISAHRSDYGGVPGKNLFQTEASINRGNSGGPLLDEKAVMIGINSMIARKAADGLAITDINFSIKSEVALNWLGRVGYRLASVKAVPSGTGQKPANEEVETPKEPARPLKEVETPKRKPVKEKKNGKILTRKRPYNMDELIAGMQEMEDLMEEMRGTIEEFRRRRR